MSALRDLALSLGILAVAGCGTRSYTVEVLSEPAGVRIEINGDYVGHTPLEITMRGDRHGRVAGDYVVRAYPMDSGYYPQVKSFAWRTEHDRDMIPGRIYFDMRCRQPGVGETRPGQASSGQPDRRRPRWP